ncbi:MAG: hypothetical protein ACYTKD_14985 [Planctomycetota bacterium]|jgi:hypothetical protein
MLFVAWGTPDPQVIDLAVANPLKGLWSIDDNGVIHTFSVRDLRWEKAAKEWQRNGSLAYLILDPIGGYVDDSPGGGNIIDDFGRHSNSYGASKEATQRLVGPGGIQCAVFVAIGVPEAKFTVHELLSTHIRGGPRVTSDHGTTIIESTDYLGDAHYATWSSEPDIIIYVHGQEYPSEILDAYAKKYPSNLPADLKIDVLEWGSRELFLRLGEMRERLELPDQNLTYRSGPDFETSLSALALKFDVTDLAEEHLRERKRLHAELIAGKEWRQDYDGYRRELIARRRKILATVEDMAERAKTDLRFSKSKRKFVVGGEPAAPGEPAEGTSPATDADSDGASGGSKLVPGLVALGVVAVGATVVLVRRSRSKAG